MANRAKHSVLSFIALSSFASSQEPPKIEFENETSWNTRYVWRGLVLDNKPAIQSDNRIQFGNASFSVWSTGRSLRAAFLAGSDEVDYTAAYATKWGSVELEPSLTLYTYSPGSGEKDSYEPGLYASHPWGDVVLFTNHYLDVGTSSGAYFGEIGVEYEGDLSDPWSWGAMLSIGWANKKFNSFNLEVDRSAINCTTALLTATYRLGPTSYARCGVTFSSLLDGHLRDASDRPDNVVWTLAFGFAK